MRLYEVVYILDPALDEGAVTQKLEKFHALATVGGGEVVMVDLWGVRQLAYPIQKKTSGYYVVAHVNAAAEALPEFERLLKLDEEVMRYLLVLNEGEPTTGNSIVAESTRPERPDDDDAEDEEEEDDDDGRESPPEFQGGRGRRRRMEGPPIMLLNYKDVSTLSRFMTEQGKILP
ncbi:MAG: 30S ribosomal protein S6, partial [Gemmatimonadota bacterium]|nr:30S ribosomal protein S6 [Gemmatimonadota bacterium]